jgi:hypothetical protein
MLSRLYSRRIHTTFHQVQTISRLGNAGLSKKFFSGKTEPTGIEEPIPNPPLLKYVLVGTIAYGSIYVGTLGGILLAVEHNLISCDFFGLSLERAIDQVCLTNLALTH